MKTCAALNTEGFASTSSLTSTPTDKPSSPTDSKPETFIQSQTASPIELIAQPNTIRICANQQAVLNISARLKNSYLLQMKDEYGSNGSNESTDKKKKNKNERFNHLLVGRIKDTNMMFSYLV